MLFHAIETSWWCGYSCTAVVGIIVANCFCGAVYRICGRIRSCAEQLQLTNSQNPNRLRSLERFFGMASSDDSV
jgi:hypothetical protein